jgi:prepilin-type N-terminal cleavage/methylation domain-containing protein/prepilin-type processing-associated H-X9-DG protein
MKKKGFTLIELLVVIAIIAMLLAILMPALNKVKKIAQRVVCATNLKGMGTAHTVYANDYEDDFVLQGGGVDHSWGPTEVVTPGFQVLTKNWMNEGSPITIGATLYLLVREADVSPKSFICGAGGQTEYDGINDNSLDIVELWDFGHEVLFPGTGPRNCVSYSFQFPYSETGSPGRYAADGTKSAAFAVMADKNPWMDPKLEDKDTHPSGTIDVNNWTECVGRMAAYYLTGSTISESSWEVKKANAYPHSRDGQNVLFGDGHANYEKVTDVGVKHDGIYTKHSTGTDEPAWRSGVTATGTYIIDLVSVQPMGSEDSVLCNDDMRI